MILETNETFWTLLHDTAHWEFEIFVTIVVDLLFGALVWNRWLKPLITKQRNKTIEEEHSLHNISETHT